MNSKINNINNAYLRIEYLPFDSGIFGFICGKLYIHRRDLTKKILKSALLKVKKSGFKHLVVKVPSQEVYLCNLLEDSNFRFKTCSLELQKSEFRKEKRIRNVFPYSHEYKDQLVAITKRGFLENTRFHFEDEFKKKKVNGLYGKWILNLIKDKDVKIFMYISNKSVAGYITVKWLDKNSGKAHIGLFVVRKEQRGKGVGVKLLKSIYAAMPGPLKNLSVMTESINYPALKVYVKSGFIIIKSWNIFHLIL